MKVLLIDTEPAFYTTIQKLLKEAGHTVAVLHSSDMAMAVTDRDFFDAVITRQNIPGAAKGLQVLENVREKWGSAPQLFLYGGSLERGICKQAAAIQVIIAEGTDLLKVLRRNCLV